MDAFAYTIFCDDIRHEVGSKISFIGCYSVAMFIPEKPPLILPKFGISVNFISPKEKLRSFEIHIFMPLDPQTTPSIVDKLSFPDDGMDAVELIPPYVDPDVIQVARITRNIVISPLEIKAEGNIKVRIVFNGKTLRAGALRVISTQPASIQPSAAAATM